MNVAPGIGILSTVPSGYANKIKKRIISTAVDLEPNGRDNLYGAGRINAYAATNR